MGTVTLWGINHHFCQSLCGGVSQVREIILSLVWDNLRKKSTYVFKSQDDMGSVVMSYDDDDDDDDPWLLEFNIHSAIFFQLYWYRLIFAKG